VNSKNREGVALLMALGVLMILGLMGSVFLAHMRLESAYAARDANRLKAHYLAAAAVEDAIARLSSDPASVDAYTDSWWTGNSPKMRPIGDGGYSLIVTDESSKIDVLNASPQVVGALLGGDKEALAALLNFRASQKIFTIDDFANADLKADSFSKLTTLATVLNTEKININTAGADVLAALPGMSADAAQAIIEFRKGADGVEGTSDDFVFAAPADLIKVPGLTPVGTAPALPLLKVNSNIFRVEAVGSVLRGSRTVSNKKIVAVMKRNQDQRVQIISWEGL
jgi:type II secretory pathway component PulK